MEPIWLVRIVKNSFLNFPSRRYHKFIKSSKKHSGRLYFKNSWEQVIQSLVKDQKTSSDFWDKKFQQRNQSKTSLSFQKEVKIVRKKPKSGLTKLLQRNCSLQVFDQSVLNGSPWPATIGKKHFERFSQDKTLSKF